MGLFDDEPFYRIGKLPPYVFAVINDMRAKARAAGLDVIDLGMGNPDGATPKTVVQKLAEAARDKRNHRYSQSRGIPRLRQEITKHSGTVLPLDRADVDTDQIIPKQFLKRVERTGYGPFLFWDWRATADGTPISDFVLNQEQYDGASILIARENFGCGSSREHAAWALRDHGIRVVLAPSFADIFRENADQNGIAALEVPAGDVERLLARAVSEAPLRLSVDIGAGTVSDAKGVVAHFELDDFRRMCLMEGLDRIGLTLRHAADIAAYERKRWPALAR
jgi:3-isopropylmalate/(R)-2-methylmalate dehydratase small subunit